MSKFYASLALWVLLTASGGAIAAEATGWITHLDQETDQIVLDDGRIFAISDEINFSSLKDGVKVRIHYDAIGDVKVAREIMLAPQAPQSAEFPKHGNAPPICVGDQKDHMAGRITAAPDAVC
jgi:hypothetical protein